MKNNKLRRLTIIALFTALAYATMYIINFKVMFLSFDAKDTMIAILGLIYGPIPAGAVVVITSLIEFVSMGSTGVYGLIMDIISGLAFCLPLAFVYQRKRTSNFAIIGLISSVLSVAVVMILANLLVTPYYMGVSIGDVVGLIPTLLLPFNLAKAVFNFALVLIIYKPLSTVLKRAKLIPGNAAFTYNKKSLILLIVGVLLVALTSVFILQVLGGSADFFG